MCDGVCFLYFWEEQVWIGFRGGCLMHFLLACLLFFLVPSVMSCALFPSRDFVFLFCDWVEGKSAS